MQPRVVTVGPLAAASATNIGLAQSPGGAGALALNGSLSPAIASNICLSQTTSGAANLVLNGVTASGSPATANLPRNAFAGPIYITSGGNDSGITFTVLGLDLNNVAQTEVLTGTNASVVSTSKSYSKIIRISTSGATSGSGVTVGTNGVAILDTARRVIFTSSGNDSGLTITLSGTDWAGTPISETITGANGGAASSVLDYLTVTQALVSGATAGTISIGTNSVAGSPWIAIDSWAFANVAGECAANGTVNYTVQCSNDDPASYGNPVARSSVVWDSNFAGVVGATGSVQFGLTNPPSWIRVVLASGSGSVRMNISQLGAVCY